MKNGTNKTVILESKQPWLQASGLAMMLALLKMYGSHLKAGSMARKQSFFKNCINAAKKVIKHLNFDLSLLKYTKPVVAGLTRY